MDLFTAKLEELQMLLFRDRMAKCVDMENLEGAYWWKSERSRGDRVYTISCLTHMQRMNVTWQLKDVSYYDAAVVRRAVETFVPPFAGPLTLVFLCSGFEVSETMFCFQSIAGASDVSKVVFVDRCNGPIMTLDRDYVGEIPSEQMYDLRDVMRETDEPYAVQCDKDLPGLERYATFDQVADRLPGYENCVVLGFCALTRDACRDPGFARLCGVAESCSNVAQTFRHWRTFRGPADPNPWETADGGGAVSDMPWPELAEVGRKLAERSRDPQRVCRL
jgi:hypothetical protein